MPCQRHTRRQRNAAAGFTLVEVILALVVLGGSVAILGEIMRISNEHSNDSRAETQAQIFAESIMDEIIAGYIDANDVRDEQLESGDGMRWKYSVTIGNSVIEGILPVEVVVQQDIEERLKPVKYRLLRWLPSVAEVPEEDEEAAEAEEEAAAEGTSSSGSGGGGT